LTAHLQTVLIVGPFLAVAAFVIWVVIETYEP